jgi:hypothetical protein
VHADPPELPPLWTIRWTALPGFELWLEAPTLTVFPPSDAEPEPEFVAAQATKAPWVTTSAAIATAAQTFI